MGIMCDIVLSGNCLKLMQDYSSVVWQGVGSEKRDYSYAVGYQLMIEVFFECICTGKTAETSSSRLLSSVILIR